jgi:hypothetical protein
MAKIMVVGLLMAVAKAFSLEAMLNSVSAPNNCTDTLFHIMNNV